jgi:D-serine deaminase-like pyridoxal phosphate-dependent protein
MTDVLAVALPVGLSDLPTPALLVDLNRLEANVRNLASCYAQHGIALRPHIKTSKTWPVARRQLQAGAIGFTCSTPAEVQWLRDHGVRDLVWAHLPVGAAKVGFAVSTPGLKVMLDSMDVARPLSAAADAAGVELPYLLEVDTGHGRTGVQPADAVALAAAIAKLSGLRLCGVLTHEGQLAAAAGGRVGLEQAGRDAGQLVVGVARELRDQGHAAEIVSVGSTPGATSAALVDGVTEARPGTYVYYDMNQVRLQSAAIEQCALTVLATVVSVRSDGTALIDAGLKAMSSDAISVAQSLGEVCDLTGTPIPELAFPTGNEEHGFLSDSGRRLRVGDRVRLVPNHACGTTNMWSTAHAVRDDMVVERWQIAARH